MAVDTKVTTTVDVAIIGGGPTGLLSALLLQQLGVSVLVFDAKPGPLKLGRADALNARTQQYLRVTGILDELLEKGIRCNTSSTFADGDFKSRQNAWWTSITHCEFPNFLMIGQPVIEEVLLSKLAPGTVHHSEEVVDITENGDLVGPAGAVEIKTASGHAVRAQYAIAADGARSSIRNFLGISFTGTKPEMTWAVLDTFIDTDFPQCSEIITFQLDGQSRVSWIPRERGMARFYVLLDGEITQQRAEESVRQHMAPHKIHFRETEWFSTFEIKERIASTFISRDGGGRVFLAGDSAHVHSVNGGQGLNTGLADAFALAWRLAAVIHHHKAEGVSSVPETAASRILRSYDTERRAIAQDVINVAAALVRDTMHTAKQYVGTIEKNAGYITGMGVSYVGVGSDLLVASSKGIWTAGQRCPDIEVLGGPLPGTNRLYSLLSYGQWLILSIGEGDDVDEDGDARAASPAQYFKLLPMQSSEEQKDGLDAQAEGSGDGTLRSKDVELRGSRFVAVVRPDMYVGYVGDASGAKAYIADNCLAA